MVNGFVREVLDSLLSQLDLVGFPGKPDIGKVGQHYVVVFGPNASDLVSISEEVLLSSADVLFVGLKFKSKVGGRA